MRSMRKVYPYTILLAILTYVVCAYLAYHNFPKGYSPLNNWLSDLGDFDHNPTGAVFYNLGVAVIGLQVLLFFLGISSWQIKANRIQHLMVRITQLFGIFGSVALIMSALFPINQPQHQFWSISLYILLGTAFAFSVSALRYHPECPKWILALGVLTAAMDIISGIFHHATMLEWLTVGLFLIYLFTLSVITREIQG